MATIRIAPAAQRIPRWPVILIAVVTSIALLLTPAGAQAQSPPDPDPAPTPLSDLDTRTRLAGNFPDTAQRDLVEQLDATVRWNRFGTPQSLIRPGAYLATGRPGADPTAAARAWLSDHRHLYRLESTAELTVHTEVALTDDAYVVVFRQRSDGLLVAPEGFVTIGLVGSPEDWRIAYASATLVPSAAVTGESRLSAPQALAAAAGDAGAELTSGEVTTAGRRADWTVLRVTDGYEQLVRPVAFPLPGAGLRAAYETVYFDGLAGYRHVIDAETGEVRYRESIVHDAGDDPRWEVYPAVPPMTRLGRPRWHFPDVDRRDLWCWSPGPGCRMELDNDAARVPWDVDARTGEPTFTTTGNAVDAVEWWSVQDGPGQRPTSPPRDYRFDWDNSWYAGGCDSGELVPGGNDIDASVANLFAGNWRMHDWSYHLGFTEQTWNAQDHNFGVNADGEGDPVIARAQAGALDPGLRNNASMATRPDGTSSYMNMFLWQPQASGLYGPCVVGDFDMTVIGHEYTHMIENRLIGKGGNRSGFHAGAMGESWSDFVAMEYLNEYRLIQGPQADRWTVGAYVTGNPERGIRNYNMSHPSAGAFPEPGRVPRVNPLNLGAIGYDLVGPQVHSDSQIWSATNYDLRTLLLDRYPSEGADQQRQCADGARPVDQCPGNRRWIQLVFDAMLLMPTAPTMLDARDAYLAADLLRTGGADQDLLWLGFARRGFGADAVVEDTQDTDPVPSHTSPLHEPATLTFEAVAKDEDGQPVEADVFVGHYEARGTPLKQVEQFVPDPDGYTFVARADGYGHVRFHVDDLSPGEERTITVHFPTNVASQAQGAVADGDGTGHAGLIDDTEATNWERTDPERPVGGAQVTVALDGARSFTLAKASAMLLPGQNRFTALRQFEVYACTAGDPANPTCDGAVDSGWDRVLRSHRDAFPAPNPRPAAPDLILRSFPVPDATATHVKFVVVTNQCTGYAGYQGEQHRDPAAPRTDCRSTPVGANEVRAAELQLFTSTPRVDGAALVD